MFEIIKVNAQLIALTCSHDRKAERRRIGVSAGIHAALCLRM